MAEITKKAIIAMVTNDGKIIRTSDRIDQIYDECENMAFRGQPFRCDTPIGVNEFVWTPNMSSVDELENEYLRRRDDFFAKRKNGTVEELFLALHAMGEWQKYMIWISVSNATMPKPVLKALNDVILDTLEEVDNG